MKDRFDKTLLYLIITIILYYSLPLICYYLNAPGNIYNALPAIDVCISLMVGFFFGKRYGSDWLIALESAVVFIPCMFMFFNPSAWIFALLILVGTVFSVSIGKVFGSRFR